MQRVKRNAPCRHPYDRLAECHDGGILCGNCGGVFGPLPKHPDFNPNRTLILALIQEYGYELEEGFETPDSRTLLFEISAKEVSSWWGIDLTADKCVLTDLTNAGEHTFSEAGGDWVLALTASLSKIRLQDP